MSEPFGNEKKDLDRLFRLSPAGQVRMDRLLHSRAIHHGRFEPEAEKMLSQDAVDKGRLEKLFSSPDPDPREAQNLIGLVRRDMKTHVDYLGRPEQRNTGSHRWHQAWLDVYTQWEKMLHGIMRTA